MEKQIRYIQDDTGLNYSNIIENEHHHLEDRRFKCMVLVHGAFFADTVVIKQKGTNYQLVHNRDYVFSDIDIEASERTGQTVACVLIIINHKLGRDFIVKYRSAGIPLGSLNERTVALLEAPGTGLLSDSYYDVRQKPNEFEPAFHYHFISSIQKMEYLLFFIEKIRIAILYDITTPFRQYMQTVERIIQGLTNKANDEVETQIEIGFEIFKQSITKLSVGVDKVPNLPLISSRDALDISLDKLHLANPEGLLALKSFIQFKNGLYNTYLGSDLTRLDRSEGTVVIPNLDILLKLMVGITILFDSYSENVNAGIQFDRLAYPTINRSNSHFSIKKLANDVDKNSCLLLAIEIETSTVFIGKLTKTNVGNLIVWKDIKEPPNIKLSTLGIQQHMSDWDNPHKDTKASVELNFMENLPIASEFDILTDSIARKYITWRQLSKFMRRFLLKHRPNKTEQLLTVDENAMRNFSVVFSPCGQTCGSTSDCKTFVTNPIVEPSTQEPVFVTWSVTPNTSIIRPNETVTFTVKVENMNNVTNFKYVLEGNGVSGAKFTTALTGADSINSEKNINFTLRDRETIEGMTSFRLLILDTITNQVLAISTYVGVDNVVFKADYFVIEYKFVNGRDLDTRTMLIDPPYPTKIGWCMEEKIIGPQGFTSEDERAFLIWGNDNTGTGTETIIFYLDRFKSMHPNKNRISLDCSAWWYNIRGDQPVGLKVTLYKGGTPNLVGYHWKVVNPISSTEVLSSTSVITQTSSTCVLNPTHIGVISCDLTTDTWTIT